ncbi:hypothetical protein KHA93_06615 [Bacillus sp. FJAT-49732]|uniref:AbiTii domain-containing protein n=1 Tax=Lederbergia citrisecunda TaxID=2833583 RepID=A0A942YL68_9BACI|nr:hypothetical protein [Lederbergia citrisecunda]
MARSQLLKDVVNGKESIESILLRLKVILSDLDNDAIINWVEGELKGYKEQIEVPPYRVLRGAPKGTYIINQVAQYTNANVPLRHILSEVLIDKMVTLDVTDSIGALQNILNSENRDHYQKLIPTEFCHTISTMELQITGMTIYYGANQLDAIVSNVKAKLVEVIMELEKQFENLDDLDIKDQVVDNREKKEEVVGNIQQIIFDNSINVGDRNKIGRSKLGHWFGGGR